MRPPNLGTSIPAAPGDAPTLSACEFPVQSPAVSAQGRDCVPWFCVAVSALLVRWQWGVGRHPRAASWGGGNLKLAAPMPPLLPLQQPGCLGEGR